jgi:DNA processing protein
MRKDYLYWIWLSLRFGQAADGFIEVLEAFGDPYNAYIADGRDLSSRFSADSPLVDRLRDKDITEARRIYDFCVSRGVSILTYGDIEYPARLKTIQHPPILLYYIGTLPSFNRKLCLAVVGTRRMSEYGKRMAYKISYELSAAGAVIVSGMALGCDAVAAGGAIASGGQTVAVLGSGIDVVYPRQHLKLMEMIAQNGAVITEYPPGSPPIGTHFPVRNRIISGLCQGTLAVEGNLHSGALLTVGHAIRQGRQVFAVPGNVGESTSEGTNELIRNGATVVLEAADILNFYEVTHKAVLSLDRYHAAKLHSSLDEGVLLRMGISSRLSERAPAGERQVERVEDFPAPTVQRKRTPEDIAKGIEGEERPASRGEALPTPPVSPDRPKKARKKVEPADASPRTPGEMTAEGDRSAEILASLSDRDRRIFTEMPLDRAISIDRLSALGFSIGDIMTAMTILEIRGLVTSLPGGLYLRK